MDDYAEYEVYAHSRYVREKLAEAETQAADPGTVWISEEDFWNDDKTK